MPKLKQRKPLSKEMRRLYILEMHQPDGTMFFQRYPTSYSSAILATEAAREKHSRYSKRFSVYRLMATTVVDPSNIQLELFK